MGWHFSKYQVLNDTKVNKWMNLYFYVSYPFKSSTMDPTPPHMPTHLQLSVHLSLTNTCLKCSLKVLNENCSGIKGIKMHRRKYLKGKVEFICLCTVSRPKVLGWLSDLSGFKCEMHEVAEDEWCHPWLSEDRISVLRKCWQFRSEITVKVNFH